MMTTMAALLGGIPLAFGTRHRLGAAQAAGHCDGRRPAAEPGADAVHDAGDLYLLRQPGDAVLEEEAVQHGRASLRRRAHHESLRAIHPPAGSDYAADGGDCDCGRDCVQVLPVSPLPQVDFPTISVNAGLPGASAEIMASSVATPLERQFGHIAGVTEMTSSSSLGTTSITIQFDLSRNIDGAARDVQAAINAARTYLPANLPGNPTYRKVNPADAPIMIIGLTSDKYGPDKLYDEASTIMQQKMSQIQGVGQVNAGGGALPSVRVEVNPTKLAELWADDGESAVGAEPAELESGQGADHERRYLRGHYGERSDIARGGLQADHRGVQQRRGGAAVGCGGRYGFGAEHARGGLSERQARGDADRVPPAGREHHRYGGPDSRGAAFAGGVDSRRASIRRSCWIARRRSGHR